MPQSTCRARRPPAVRRRGGAEMAIPPPQAAPTISVIVPVYNSQDTLNELVSRLRVVLDEAATAWEIVLVNDCSRDASWPAIERLAADEPRVQGINLMRNYGQHNALLCGIRAARYDVIVTLDDDLQNPPEEVPKLLAKL